MRPATLTFLIAMSFVAVALCGCGGAQTPEASDAHDVPVPQTVKRATVTLVVDLVAAGDCDERFDLALYRADGVDLVEWDKARACESRRVKIRYLPERITRDALLRRVRELSKKIEVVEG